MAVRPHPYRQICAEIALLHKFRRLYCSKDFELVNYFGMPFADMPPSLIS